MSEIITEPIEEFIIKDIETLKVLSHPQRLEILRNFDVPRTVKEVAERIEADPTKLYYHVRLLEKANIIIVVETNVVAGIIEKTYQASAKGFRVDEELIMGSELEDDDYTNLVNAVYDSSRRALLRSLRAKIVAFDQQTPVHDFALFNHHLRLTDKQLRAFGEQMEALTNQLTQWNEENTDSAEKEYLFTIAFFPTIPNKS